MKLAAVAAAAVAGLAGLKTANAASFVWDGGGADFNWETSANWDPDGTPFPNDAGDDITFNTVTTPLTSPVLLGAPKTIGTVLMNLTGGTAMTLGSAGEVL